ncbi:MAG TPA: hypothetical protein VFW95_11000 [Candidatus Limnocylindria bacterium]|nr:hypothetical protein [Candidatus Limnocylindria bacterium]
MNDPASATSGSRDARRDTAWRAAIIALGAIVLLGLVAASMATRLNGDVQYVLGGLSVAGDIGWVDTFVHRPLPYRLFMSILNVGAGLLGLHTTDYVAYESVVRAGGIALALVSGALLWRALVPRLGRAAAAVIGGATSLALILAPAHDVLQAEWAATSLAVIALAVALLPRRDATAGVLAGFFLVVVAGMKISTVFLVPAVLVVLAMLDARRIRPVIVGTVGWGIAYAAVLMLLPLERQWTFDSAALNALGSDRNLHRALVAFSEKAMVSPVILFVPCALMMALGAMGGTLRRRLLVGAGVVGTALLLIGTSLAQGTWQVYHLAPVPVAATGFVAGVGVWWWMKYGQPPWPIVVGIPVAAALGIAFLSLDTPTRIRLAGEARVIGLVVAVLACAWAVALVRLAKAARSASEEPPCAGQHAGAVALVIVAFLAFLPAQAPNAAWSVARDRTNASWNAQSDTYRQALADLAADIGHGGPVLYLAFGNVPYHMGIPTTCRYPSPLWVQRGTYYESLRELWSYKDNLACFDGRLANDVVIETGWATPGKHTDDLVRGLRDFDCTDPPSRAGVEACPSRLRGDAP